jgi:hypothetical protein
MMTPTTLPKSFDARHIDGTDSQMRRTRAIDDLQGKLMADGGPCDPFAPENLAQALPSVNAVILSCLLKGNNAAGACLVLQSQVIGYWANIAQELARQQVEREHVAHETVPANEPSARDKTISAAFPDYSEAVTKWRSDFSAMRRIEDLSALSSQQPTASFLSDDFASHLARNPQQPPLRLRSDSSIKRLGRWFRKCFP